MKKEPHATNVIAKDVIGQPTFGFMPTDFYHGHVRLITVHFVKVPRRLPATQSKLLKLSSSSDQKRENLFTFLLGHNSDRYQ